uniref:Major facilitator superfamily (MFS) profile domain-containing protein n=2 Tax=Chrysotila carterae TaxID=13221 RepID=A0A7S4EV31_CHRCT
MSVAILPMSEQFGYSDSVKGLIASAFSLGYCIGLVPAGVASSSSSPKMVLGIGLVVWSLAQALTPAAAENSVLSLLLARVGMGIGEAAAIPSIQVIAANFVPQRFRSQFWGLLTASLSMGTIGAYTLTPPLVDSAGWQSAFFIYGGAGIAISALWFALGADEPKSRDACFPEACELEEEAEATRRVDATKPVDESGVAGAMERAMERVREVPWSDMAVSRPVWALAAAHSASNFFLYFALSWLPTYFAYQFNLSTAGAASASQLPFVAAAVASVSAGAICDRVLVGWAGLPLTRARKVMQGIACVGPGAAMVSLALLASGVAGLELNQNTAQAIFVGALACQSFSAAGFGCAAQDISRRYSSLLYGSTSAVSVVVGAFGQYFTGVILDLTDRDFSAMFYLTGAVELCGVLMFTAWWNSERTFE